MANRPEHITANIRRVDPTIDYEYVEIQNPNEIAQPYEEKEYFDSPWDATLKYKLVPLNEELHRHFVRDPYKEPIYTGYVIRNRQVFLRTLSQVAREWNLPIADIESGEETDYDMWREPFQTYEIQVTLGPGPWVRENPALERFLENKKNGEKEDIYDAFPPSILFHFQDQEEGTEFHKQQDIQLINVHPAFLIPLAFVVDDMLWTFLSTNLSVEPPPANKLMAEAKNISRRRIVSKVMESKVGDPYFAKYIGKFATEIPRRAIHPEIKNIKSNVFQGGKRKTRKTRKARKGKKRATTRK